MSLGKTRKYKKGQKVTYRGKRWVFTLNNPEFELSELLEKIKTNDKVQYFKCAHEAGEEKGTKHFQGYIELSEPSRFSGIQAIISKRCWPRLSFGNPKEASEYCGNLGKSGEVFEVVEHGEMLDFSQGARSDLVDKQDTIDHIQHDIDHGMSLWTVWRKYFRVMIYAHAGIEKYYNIVNHNVHVRYKNKEKVSRGF